MPKDLTFEIAPDLCGDFPELEVRLLRARIADQSALAPALARLSGPLGAAAEALRDIEPITSLEDIARWRRAYAGIGVKPSKFPSSLEALMRRAKKGQMAEVGIPAVDLYNAISVIRRAPLGAYDMARLGPEPMLLRRANPADDRFEPLGAAPEAFPLNPELVVHAQGARVLCWGFNTRDSAGTAVETASEEIVFVSELTESAGREAAEAAMADLAQAFSEAGGQAGETVVVSSAKPTGVIRAL